MTIDVKSVCRKGVITIAVVFGGLGLWMATAPLHGAVVVHGLVKVETNRKTIQHNEGGIVDKVLVRDGDIVKRGQTLIQLEDASVSAQYGILRGALDAQLARQARLHAEATFAEAVAFPEELKVRVGEGTVTELLQREQALFDTRRSALAEQIRLSLSQIGEIRSELVALSKQRGAEIDAQDLASEELGSYEKLQEKQYIAEVRILAQKRLVAEYDSRSREREADSARARQRIEDMNGRIASLKNEYTSRAAEELKESGVQVLELRERLLPSEDAMRRQSIVAPVTGKIIGLRVHTEGATIAPRDPLMDIVPQADGLIIEAQAPLDAIRQLHLGQHAEIRFSALPYRTTPMISGKVTYISGDALSDKDGNSFFQVQVLPDAKSLSDARITALDPGMAAEVYIQTQARTALEYLLRPITDSVRRSFREN